MPATRTWPYGTRLKVKVLEVQSVTHGVAIFAKDEVGEGHVLHLERNALDLKPDDHFEMEFVNGGPIGGYWSPNKKVTDG